MSHKDEIINEVDGIKIVKRTQIAPPLGTPQKPSGPFVPITEDGNEGLSSCCGCAVTYSGDTLCCKKCWQAVTSLHVNSERLQKAIEDCLFDDGDINDLRRIQNEVLKEAGIL